MDEMSLSEALAKLSEYGARKTMAASVRQVSDKKESRPRRCVLGLSQNCT